MNQKNRGSYYTPLPIASFVLRHVFPYIKELKEIRILEPSVGDGAFIKAMKNLEIYDRKQINFTAIEKYIQELRKAETESKYFKGNKISFNFIKNDFLKHNEPLSSKYQLIIGNPPFIKKK